MSIIDEINKVKAEFPSTTSNADELQRLNRFLAEMRQAGVAKTQQYNIPQPDTIGYVLVNTPSKTTS